VSASGTVLFNFITFKTPDVGEVLVANNLRRKRIGVEVIKNDGTVQKCTDFSGW